MSKVCSIFYEMGSHELSSLISENSGNMSWKGVIQACPVERCPALPCHMVLCSGQSWLGLLLMLCW